MTKSPIRTIVAKLLARRNPLTYVQIVDKVHQRYPEAQTSVKTVQWYASRLRKSGADVRVRLDRHERRNWKTRPDAKPAAQAQ